MSEATAHTPTVYVAEMDSGQAVKLNDPSIPTTPGVYVVHCDAPIGSLSWSPITGPAYVGKTDTGLRSRITRTHLGDTGRSTLRRAYGALRKEELDLRAKPRPSRRDPRPINFTSYVFEEPGDSRLTEWMLDHLTVVPIPTANPVAQETELISQYSPQLNLRGWPNMWNLEIRELRRQCADEARLVGLEGRG